MADTDKKRTINKKINVEYTQEELDRLNLYAKNFKSYLEMMKGSKWRDDPTLLEKNRFVAGSMLLYFEMLNKIENFTGFQIDEISYAYERTGKFPEQFYDMIKDYQDYINKILTENNLYLERNTDKSEKKLIQTLLKEAKYTNEKEFNKKMEGKIKELKRTVDARFEFKIDEKGKGEVIIYEKNEKNNKYEKRRTVEFDLKKNTYNTILWQIRVDGKIGTETTTAVVLLPEVVKKIEEPATIIPLGFSMNEYYTNRNYSKTNLFTYTSINNKSPLSQIQEIMKELSPESQKKILFDEKYKKYDMHLLLNKSTDKYGDKDIDTIKKLVEDFKKDTKDLERRKEKTFYFTKENEKTTNFKIDYSIIETHLKKLGLSKDEIEVMINEIEKIKNKSNDNEDFLAKLDENEKIKKMFQKVTIDFGYCPLEANLYEMSIYKYSPKSNDEKNMEITKILKKYMNENEEFNNKINKYLKTDLKKYKEEHIDISSLKKDFPKIYDRLILDLHEIEYNRIIEPLNTMQNATLAKSIPKTDKVEQEYKKEKTISSEIKISKSPSQKETEDFIKLMKNNSALAKVYQEYYNERMKEEKKKYRLKVDGIVGDKTIATSNELPFDEFWALYNKQNTYEREILPKVKEKIKEDPIEMRRYNAYVQKMDKESGGRPVEDKWTYLTSYINRLESVKKQQKEENIENKYKVAK